MEAGFNFVDNGIEEKNVYFYHPDHLGSSSHITDINGNLSQHTEFMAFGEILFDEHSTSITMPYLFNGKELDSETNLTYYGARYLDMKTSLWLNTDPLSGYNPIFEHEHYIDGQHNGGVFNPMNLNTYTYTYQNPIRYIDPNGKQTESYATKRHDDNDISQIVTIRGRRYYQNTTNTWAIFKNKVNSWFGGDSDYWVDKKPYNFEDNLMIHRTVDESMGALAGGATAKIVGSLLGNIVSKVSNRYIPNAGKLVNSMLTPTRGRQTEISLALQKHTLREGSVFGSKFSGKTGTSDGMKIIDEIVSSNKLLIDLEKNGTKTIYDKVTGRGFNINRQGEFGGFRELPLRNVNNVQKVLKK
ncbi:MAG: RHS repeat-associated core domain-containing protein [Cruoricaptor ignavus]|nr:RHS repeat-associated core domain-containing protein [Cruoricaptor ignavus]